MSVKVKELAKSRAECAEKEATLASTEMELQRLNKAMEEERRRVKNSEEEVIYKD